MKRQYKVVLDEDDSKKLFEKSGTIFNFPSPCQKQHNLFGLSSFNLRSGGHGTNDDSLSRELISSRIFADFMKSPSQQKPLVYRLAHTQLYIRYCRGGAYRVEDCEPQMDYKGLYYIAEEIDKTFLKSRFESTDSKSIRGALYGGTYATAKAKANFRSENFHSAAYKPKTVILNDSMFATEGTIQALESESKACVEHSAISKEKDAKDQRALLLMCTTIKKLEAITKDDSSDELRELFDLDNIFGYMAAVNFTGHWDSLASNANNDRLYFNARIKSKYGGKWQVITWDLDNTLGVMADEQRRASVNDLNVKTKSALFDFILSDDSLRASYQSLYRQRLQALDPRKHPRLLRRVRSRVTSALQGSWEESIGIDYDLAFDYIAGFLDDRWKSVTRELL